MGRAPRRKLEKTGECLGKSVKKGEDWKERREGSEGKRMRYGMRKEGNGEEDSVSLGY